MTLAVVLAVMLATAAVLVLPGRAHLLPATRAPAAARPDGSAGSAGSAGSGGAAGPADVAETCRLLASALRSGVGVLEAVETVAEHGPPTAAAVLQRVAAAHRWTGDDDAAWAAAGPGWAPVADALAAATTAGASPVRALDAAALAVEREQRARAVEAVRRLEVLVVLPLGLAFLPGFVLTTVVPIVLGLVRSVALP